MDVSTFVFGTALAVLPLVGAGLLAALVLLERRAEHLSPVPAHPGRARARDPRRPRRPGGRRPA